MCFEADSIKRLAFQNLTIHSLYRIPWFDYLNELKIGLLCQMFYTVLWAFISLRDEIFDFSRPVLWCRRTVKSPQLTTLSVYSHTSIFFFCKTNVRRDTPTSLGFTPLLFKFYAHDSLVNTLSKRDAHDGIYCY